MFSDGYFCESASCFPRGDWYWLSLWYWFWYWFLALVLVLALAAALGFVNAGPEEKAAEIKEIYDYLRKQKGFGWYIGDTQRTLYAALAYTLGSMDGDSAVLNSVINATLTSIILEEILMMTVVVTAAHSSSRSSNSSH